MDHQLRVQTRGLTRLKNAFSKKWENLWAAYCLHFACCKFCRIHKTLGVTLAREVGLRQGFGVWRISWRWPPAHSITSYPFGVVAFE